jgi:hypothetical protein
VDIRCLPFYNTIRNLTYRPFHAIHLPEITISIYTALQPDYISYPSRRLPHSAERECDQEKATHENVRVMDLHINSFRITPGSQGAA